MLYISWIIKCLKTTEFRKWVLLPSSCGDGMKLINFVSLDRVNQSHAVEEKALWELLSSSVYFLV